jgi:uncharacterized Tic20 family protein
MDPSAPLPPVPSSQLDRGLAILCHVCIFFGFVFLLPLIVFLVAGGRSAWLREQAREALNFHISLVIYALVCVPLMFVLIGIPLLILLGLASALGAIIAAVRAAEGAIYRYPLTIRMV